MQAGAVLSLVVSLSKNFVQIGRYGKQRPMVEIAPPRKQAAPVSHGCFQAYHVYLCKDVLYDPVCLLKRQV